MHDCKKYLRAIKRMFPIYGTNEKKFLSNIENQVNHLGNCTYDTLVEELGEPTDIISSYYQEIDTNDLIKKLNIKRTSIYFITMITVIILSTCLWRTYILNKAYKDFESGIPVELQETIIEIGD